MGNPRDQRLDVLKGVLIALVVLGHCLEVSGGRPPEDLYSGWFVEPQRGVLLALYSFHMPVFVFLAGVTASPRGLRSRVVQMLTLVVVFQLLYVTPLVLLGKSPATYALPFFGLWFLFAMVWWLLALPLVVRWPVPAVVVSLVLAVASAAIPVTGAPLGWSRALYFLPFFVLGHLLGPRLLQRAPRPGRAVRLAALTVAVGMVVLILVGGLDPHFLRGATTVADLDADAAAMVGGRVLGLVVALLAGSGVVVALSGCRWRWAEVLGQRTLGVYVLHLGAVFALQQAGEVLEGRIGNEVAVALAVVSSVALLVVLGRPAVVDRSVRRISTVLIRRERPATPVGADG